MNRTPFTRRLADLARNSAQLVLDAIQGDLLREPQRGDLVPGLGGIRKARCGNPGRGKGKRSGFHYFYLYLEVRGHIHFPYLLDKDEREDRATAERKSLRDLAGPITRAQ